MFLSLESETGQIFGPAWRFFEGGGSLFAPEFTGEFTGGELVFVYPDGRTGLKGEFMEAVMMDAKEVAINQVCV
jgi:hypothetical protein